MTAERAKANPLLIVISGPSGVGKDTIMARMKEMGHPFHYAVTATTRLQRPGERNEVAYHFVSEQKFQEMMAQGGFLEWARVYGNSYGVPIEQVRQALARGQDVLLKVDIQGVATIKSILPQAVFIFLAPPSLEELGRRLKGRRTESAEDLALRMNTASEEMKSLPLFDYVVVHHYGGTDSAIAQIEAIIKAEKCRVHPRIIAL